jgi:hypothetical protein
MTTNFPPPFLCQKKTSLWQRGSKVYQYILKIKWISTFYLRISVLQQGGAESIILSAGGAESMMLSACAESMTISAPPWTLLASLKKLEY